MLVNLRALLARLVDIVLLRGGPESLPASPMLLGVVIVANLAVYVIVLALIPTGHEMSILELIVSTAVPLLWYQIAFSLANKPERFVQTMIAFFGVNTLFQPVIAPMLATLLPYVEKQDPAVTPPAALSLLFFLVALWLLIVWARVVRAAFEWPYIVVIIFILGQNFAAVFVDAMLFGARPDSM
jgi:MFS-type transporter involved in bile tolerance (Atg22 family)